MLTKDRINEAESNVKTYFVEGLLKKAEFNNAVFNIFKKNAQESLNMSNFLLQYNKSSLWVIVTSYYSMFYIANAFLYKIGYKVGDKIPHKVTADALIVFARKKLKESLIENYEETKDEALSNIKSDEIIEYFDFERRKRNFIQYNTPEEIKITKVKTSLERAKEFMLEINKLLES